MTPDAAELSRMLAGQALALVGELLPAGRRDGREWRCGSLAGEAGSSLAVHLHGLRAGVWSDFASGEGGDALDLVAAVLYRGDLGQAMRWARTWLGLATGAVDAPQRRASPVPGPDAAGEAEAEKLRRYAQRMFLAAQPALAGTPAAAYLASRGIDLAELGRQPRSLRYAPALYNRESSRDWPALVAAVSDGAGRHVATHRTWLHQFEAGHWGKAPLREPKMSLGRLAGGAIRLWRGASGKPLASAPDGEAVVLGEGIENALSVVVACPELRTMAAVSLANLARVALPPAIRTVILAVDNDGDNPAAKRGLARAIDHHAAAGRVVRIARSPVGKDFNDLLVSAAP